MALKDKLKKMRVLSGMTQEAVAERLGISAQTVSKWERGLLSPDISLLPRIAVMYSCSIDSLFEMDAVFGTEHKREFKTKLHALFEAHDYEGVYNALINEIRLTPDDYLSYVDIMLHVLRRKMFERERVDAMLSLGGRFPALHEGMMTQMKKALAKASAFW